MSTMNRAQLDDFIQWEGGVVEALEHGGVEIDPTDTELKAAWHELQVVWNFRLSGTYLSR